MKFLLINGQTAVNLQNLDSIQRIENKILILMLEEFEPYVLEFSCGDLAEHKFLDLLTDCLSEEKLIHINEDRQ